MNSIRILLIEDNSSDAELIETLLSGNKSFPHTFACAKSVANGLTLLAEQTFDVIMTDLGLPDSHGLATVAALLQRAPGLPVIVLTMQGDMETALAAIKMGAQDYLPKDELNNFLLTRTIHYAIERKQLISKLQDALAEIKTLSGMLPICASCKKIRDDKGYWNQIETYLKQHTDASFTHSICPVCMVKSLEEGGLPVPVHLRAAAEKNEFPSTPTHVPHRSP